ncbi:MAG: gamma-glutamylcyclotransferase [Verrucomicrobia bacterium]|nr:gamma-glutamylcyclotransferase [Verrucomicrobiota bacterium]
MKPVFEPERRSDAGEDAGATDDFGFRAEDSPPPLVFVYGTLRSGNSDHRQLRNAKLLGRGRTREQFALYLGVTPYVVKSEKVSWIVGEAYEVDGRTLRRLDLLQQCPSWRFREWVDVVLDDGRELQAMMYFAKEKKRQLVLSGDSNTG